MFVPILLFSGFESPTTSAFDCRDDVGIAAPRGITEDSFKLMLEKFKNQAFKEFAARYQVNYLWQNLRKPVGGDYQGVRREAPGDQQLFGVFPGTGLKCPSD